MHALNRRLRRLIRRPSPVTRLVIGLRGTGKLLETDGDQAVEELLTRLAVELDRNVEPRDLCCRFEGQRLAVALMSCPAKFGDPVAERIAHNIGSAVLSELDGDPRGPLQLRWVHVTLPDDAAPHRAPPHGQPRPGSAYVRPGT